MCVTFNLIYLSEGVCVSEEEMGWCSCVPICMMLLFVLKQ